MASSEAGWTFTGFASPNFTPVPDEFFDELAPLLSGGEVKVLLYIIRRTFGFKKDRDSISLSQMLHGIVRKNGDRLDHGVGLSKPSLCRALNTLTEKQVIIATRRYDHKGSNLATSYELHMRGREPVSDVGVLQEETLGKKMRQAPLSQDVTKGLSQNLTKPLVKKRDIQETVINKQETKNVNVSIKGQAGNRLYLLPDVTVEPAHIAIIAEDILAALGDSQSEAFYMLVARKVPEEHIRHTLSELKESRARSKAKVFTHRMMAYAKEEIDAASQLRNTKLADDRTDLLARLKYE